MTVHIVTPPYCHLGTDGAGRPPAGSIMLADLSEGIPALARAVQAHLETPWCPLALLLPDRRISSAVLAAFEPVPGTWAPIYPADYAHLPLAARAVTAIRRRPVPHPTVLGLWVEKRLRRPAIAGTLATCFGGPAEPPRPTRTVTRRLQALSPYEVRDWRGLGGLARLVASLAPGLSLETQAYLADIDPRTLRRWLRLATDLPWSVVSRWAGWEWVLESALRRAGCVARPALQRVSGEGRVIRGPI